MPTAVTIDVAGGQAGGAATFRNELYGYLEVRERPDVRVIGEGRNLTPPWMIAREGRAVRRSRRIAPNNVGFFAPGGERWTLLRNALHFLTPAEEEALHPSLQRVTRQAGIVHRAARRSDVLVTPCTAMAERVTAKIPDAADRIIVRMHPVSAPAATPALEGALIFCPVLFAPYKHMAECIAEWLTAVDGSLDESVQLVVTAGRDEVPASLAARPRLRFVGRLTGVQTRAWWSRARAVYFPTGLESYGYPLAEARVMGLPVIARDILQNREIAGGALCGYQPGDADSLRHATAKALSLQVDPDPDPFDPGAYFDWLLGDLK